MNCKIAGRLWVVACACLFSPQIHASEEGGTGSSPKLFSFLDGALKRVLPPETEAGAGTKPAEVPQKPSAVKPDQPAPLEINLGKFFEKLAGDSAQPASNNEGGGVEVQPAAPVADPQAKGKPAAPAPLLSSFAKLFEGGQIGDYSDADSTPRTQIASTSREQTKNGAPALELSVRGQNLASKAGVQMVRTTAYTHTEKDHLEWGLQTASGSQLRRSVEYTSAAADWSRFPLGTVFKIKGSSRIYVIDDYGRALVGSDTIDLYNTTKASMDEWGVRTVEIEILKQGCFEKSKEILEGRRHVAHCAEMYRSLLDT